MRIEICEEYFGWLYDLVCGNRYSQQISYRKLLTHLHDTEFRYYLPKDENRAYDGTDLRWRYIQEIDCEDNYKEIMAELDKPCSVLEMMIALALRCEETIMDDPRIGDRTRQWFWDMVTSLGLGSMLDDRYDPDYVDSVMDRFLDRNYEPNGKGGLFTIRRCEYDLRTVEIWRQLLWYLDSIS